MIKHIAAYTHPPLRASTQEPDTKPGDYYVSVRDGSRTALALGPFRDDHASALVRVDDVRRHVQERSPDAHWWSFGTCRLDASDDNPLGRLNGSLAELFGA